MKDKIQSKLNNFVPYTMVDADDFAEFVGFTEEEVKALCNKYDCSFELCKSWYDGYRLGKFEVYNPESVIKAVSKGIFKSYWSGTSTYDVVAEKIKMNFSGTKEDVIAMFGGEKIGLDVEDYENTMTDFKNKDNIFTFLIHLGYLAYDESTTKCFIPNREIYAEWLRVVKNVSDYSETNKIIYNSEQLLNDTLRLDETAVLS